MSLDDASDSASACLGPAATAAATAPPALPVVVVPSSPLPAARRVQPLPSIMVLWARWTFIRCLFVVVLQSWQQTTALRSVRMQRLKLLTRVTLLFSIPFQISLGDLAPLIKVKLSSTRFTVRIAHVAS
jgi:hypothetical protein